MHNASHQRKATAERSGAVYCPLDVIVGRSRYLGDKQLHPEISVTSLPVISDNR